MISVFLTAPQVINNQRLQLLYLILIIIFLLVALIGGIGWFFERLVIRFGSQVDMDTWKIVETRVVTTPAEFKRIAFKKSHRRAFIDFFWFYVFVSLTLSILYGYMALFNDPTLINDLFDYSTRGFNTLFPIFDWENIPTNEFFGFQLISNFPTLLNEPRFVPEASIAYLLFILTLIAFIILVKAVLALFGRTLYIFNKANAIFTKNLSDVAKRL
jgi:hypothetical protein